MTTLTVRRGEPRPGQTQYAFTLWTSGSSAYGPLEQEYVVDVNQSLVQASCQEIDRALQSASERPDLLKETLRTEGRLLYRQLLQPPGGNVLELARQLRESTEPLVVHSNESVVPWELLHDGEDFLGLQVDLGRRTVVSTGVLGGRDIGPVHRALVVGDTLGDLPKAREEVERISGWLAEQGIEHLVLTGAQATLAQVIRELAREEAPYDLFHFSGHVSNAPGADGLLVHRREVIDEPALRTLAGRGAPPVVFINGCASAGLTIGVCRSFMLMGAKAVVGTRTVVDDASALRFAEEYYRNLRQLVPAGRAVRMARAALAAQGDDSWASFVLYGDPNVRIITGPRPEPANDTAVAKPGSERPFAPDAEALMLRVTRLAVFTGLITSIDLLAGLITETTILKRALPRIGQARLEALRGLLAELHEMDQASARAAEQAVEHANGSAPAVELSDTVARVLAIADETVAAAGRGTVTVDDIAAALLKVGGSACADLLERCGISMAELLAPAGAAAGNPVAPAGAQVRMDAFDARATGVIHCARLLAAARGEPFVSSYVLLKAFALTGSEAFSKVVRAQGKDTDQTLRRLTNLSDPHTGQLSTRVAAVLRSASAAQEDGARAGEEDLLRALLADPDSSAGQALARHGIDAEQAIRDLSPPD
ncbi:MAG: CHAT domain-containing protein [Catenulispora sp.]